MTLITEVCIAERAEINDAEPWTLPNVKLLGKISRNGREYPREVQEAAIPLFDGQRIYVDHPDVMDKKRPLNAQRSYAERIGQVVKGSVKYDPVGECLRGYVKLNQKHPHAEMAREDFREDTPDVGLSYTGEAKFKGIGSKGVCEGIVQVFSLDLVDRPATTHSLRESIESYEQGKDRGEMGSKLDEHEKKLAEHAKLHEEHKARMDGHDGEHKMHHERHADHEGRMKMLETSLAECEAEYEKSGAMEHGKAAEQLRVKLDEIKTIEESTKLQLSKLVSEAQAIEKKVPRTPALQPNPLEARALPVVAAPVANGKPLVAPFTRN